MQKIFIQVRLYIKRNCVNVLTQQYKLVFVEICTKQLAVVNKQI